MSFEAHGCYTALEILHCFLGRTSSATFSLVMVVPLVPSTEWPSLLCFQGPRNISIPVIWERDTQIESCVDRTRQEGRRSLNNMCFVEIKEENVTPSYCCKTWWPCLPPLVSRRWECLDSRTQPRAALLKTERPVLKEINSACFHIHSSSQHMSWRLPNKTLSDHLF